MNNGQIYVTTSRFTITLFIIYTLLNLWIRSPNVLNIWRFLYIRMHQVFEKPFFMSQKWKIIYYITYSKFLKSLFSDSYIKSTNTVASNLTQEMKRHAILIALVANHSNSCDDYYVGKVNNPTRGILTLVL